MSDAPDRPIIDTSVAHPARVYNYLLGGKDHYLVDRVVGDRTTQLLPEIVAAARANRQFVLHAVRFLAAEHGIRQFVDLGSGVPVVPSVHDVAREVIPDAVVVYVDNDPIVLAHDRALLGKHPGVGVVGGDLTDPPAVLHDPIVTELIDWSRPVGIIAAAVFHFVPDDDRVRSILDAYRAKLVPGSAVVLAQASAEGRSVEATREIEATYATNLPFRMRTAAQLRAFLDGLDLAEPGLVDLLDWRPTIEGARSGAGLGLCAVGIVT